MLHSKTTSIITKVATADENHRILPMQATMTNGNTGITKQYRKITCFVNDCIMKAVGLKYRNDKKKGRYLHEVN